MKRFFILVLAAFAGCASISSVDLKPPDAAQTTQPPSVTADAKPKVKQWFTTDTPETLPKDKLDKMNLSGAGFSGY
jgi:hypothetical protein